ncbi:hypothetical protein BCR42DRAFT_393003 [Absidia repens]|uniref:Uncharacterized protein n=1 Tax=Absidia repens TaxID=90262 RepID=A0A1X2IEI0_9FUNG|nr:hypothetical protein BCR42DRAFT_393003 [Absidia repens]
MVMIQYCKKANITRQAYITQFILHGVVPKHMEPMGRNNLIELPPSIMTTYFNKHDSLFNHTLPLWKICKIADTGLTKALKDMENAHVTPKNIIQEMERQKVGLNWTVAINSYGFRGSKRPDMHALFELQLCV